MSSLEHLKIDKDLQCKQRIISCDSYKNMPKKDTKFLGRNRSFSLLHKRGSTENDRNRTNIFIKDHLFNRKQENEKLKVDK